MYVDGYSTWYALMLNIPGTSVDSICCTSMQDADACKGDPSESIMIVIDGRPGAGLRFRPGAAQGLVQTA